jgi:TIR domain
MPAKGVDFFLSRRGSVAAVAQEVADVLTDKGYSVLVQDYDIPLTANFIEAMHEAIKGARDLIVLHTVDYEASPYTRKEFTSFEADRTRSVEERRMIILRCEDTPLRGLFAPVISQNLYGISDPQERKRRILAAAEGQSQALKPPPDLGEPATLLLGKTSCMKLCRRVVRDTGETPEMRLCDGYLVRAMRIDQQFGCA